MCWLPTIKTRVITILYLLIQGARLKQHPGNMYREVWVLDKWSIPFKEGCLEVRRKGDSLEVRGGNFTIELRPRVISVDGSTGISIEGIYGSRRKVIYIRHEGIKTLDHCNEKIEEVDLGDYIVKSTYLFTGSYITIITPGYLLVDYVVITDDSAAVVVQGKRSTYFEESGRRVTIYVV